MLGQIALELNHRFVEHDGKAGGGVERGDIGNIALDQHDTGLAQSRQRCFQYRGELGVEIFPEIAARQPEAQPFERSWRDLGRTAGNDAVEEHAVGNVARHRAGGVSGVRQRNDAGLRPAAKVVGRMLAIPQSAAGTRMDPPVSVPRAAGARRAATAAALPPLEPPGMRVGSYGLCAGPNAALLLVGP
jgi:hypothetical protein